MCLRLISSIPLTLFAVCLTLAATVFIFGTAEVPDADLSRFTGYPTWHPVRKDFSQERQDAVNAFLIVVLAAASVQLLRWTADFGRDDIISHFYREDSNTAIVPAGLFNRVLAYYQLGTLFAAIAMFILDIGKAWVGFGVLHNLPEISLLLVLLMDGRIVTDWYYCGMLAYALVVVMPCTMLDWPLDATWFLFQGMIIDYGLLIASIRVYRATRRNVTRDIDEQLPIVSQNSPPSSTTTTQVYFPSTVQHPNQFLLIVLAFLTHIIGNIVGIVFPTRGTTPIVFFATYSAMFSFIWLYVYLDTHRRSPQKRLYLPETSTRLTIILFAWCFVLTAITFDAGYL